MNKIRKGEVKIYKGKEYIAIPEIEEESCTGCCFYDKGIGKEGQFSDSDKKTAENFGCEYMDVDDFVDKYKG